VTGPHETDALSRLISGVTFLKQVDLFRDVPADYLVAVAEVAEERNCYAGEYLFREGDPGDCLYVIAEGEIRVTARGAEVARLRAGEVIGEMAVVDSQPRSATAEVSKDSRVLRIGTVEFRLLLLNHPEMAMALLRTLSRRLRSAPSTGAILDALDDGKLGWLEPERVEAAPVAVASETSMLPALVDEPLDALEPGHVLASRFRITSRLSASRYAAEDLQLGEAVSVQLVPRALAGDAPALERLRKRLGAARRLSHRNVQRAFDLLREDERVLLTLELAHGPTLEERIRQAGRLPFDEAWPIASQLASGLAALEEVGLPSGVLSSSRIVLIPESTSAEGTRRWRPLLPSVDLFESVGKTTDLSSFARLLREMSTGERTADLQAGRVDARWEPILRRCDDPEPARRYAGFAELASALAGQARPSAARRIAGVAGLAAVALGAGLLLGPALRRRAAAPTEAGEAVAPARRTIAVLGLTNSSGEARNAWLGTALAEMLVSELAVGGRVRLVPSDQVARARLELGMPDLDRATPASLEALRKRLAADFWVSGAYKTEPGKLHLDLRLLDSATGKQIVTLADDAAEERLFELAAALGSRLRYELRLGDVTKREAASVRAALPVNARAAQLYAEGLDRLRVFEAARARDLLEKAVAEDPFHALAHAALARAFEALGYDEKARDAAKKAQDLSIDLSRTDQLGIEARYRESTGERTRAIELYQKLRAAAPDDPEPALALAAVQTADGKPKEALRTVDALRRMAAGKDDPRTDLAEGEAAASLGDYKRQLLAVRRGAERGLAQGSLQVVARARLAEGRALRKLQNLGEARAAMEEARKLFQKAGDRSGVARGLTELASISAENKDAGAIGRALLAEALDVFREIEDQRGIASVLLELSWMHRTGGNAVASKKTAEQAYRIAHDIGERRLQLRAGNALATASSALGDNAEASRIFEELVATARQIGDKGSLGTLLSNAGTLKSMLGDDPAAAVRYEESIAINRELGETRMLPQTLMNLSIMELSRGRIEKARALTEESERISRTNANHRVLAYALNSLADIEFQQGRLPAARSRFEEAIELQRKLGELSEVALSTCYLASVAVDEGKASEALTSARSGAGLFQKDGRPNEEAVCRLAAAQALISLGDLRAASTELDRLRQIEAGQRFDLRLGRRMLSERIRGSSGRPGDARAALQALESMLAEAAAAHVALGFEVRLAAAEVDPDAASRRERLEALAKDAKALGFDRFVRLAGERGAPTR